MDGLCTDTFTVTSLVFVCYSLLSLSGLFQVGLHPYVLFLLQEIPKPKSYKLVLESWLSVEAHPPYTGDDLRLLNH